MSSTALSIFEAITDPRRASGHYLYPLNEIIFLTICAVISGAEDWVNISEFGKNQQEWLRQYLPYRNGIPSHDTIGRLFEKMDSSEFENNFIRWTQQVSQLTQGEVIAIDGKTVCGSHDYATQQRAIHLVSAFASANNICIGQVKTEEKSNEITAIPALLDLICIQGCLVTIDAMGCQKQIAARIIDQQADYVLALKENQEELLEEVKAAFAIMPVQQVEEQLDAGHGRIEKRQCAVISDLRFVDEASKWKNLNAIVRVKAERVDKTHRTQNQETRYYISSITNAQQINTAIRHHWGIENQLHWVLDVRFNEEGERKRKGQAAYNFSFITKTVLNLIRMDPSKGSIKTKRLKAAWNNAFRQQLLKI